YFLTQIPQPMHRNSDMNAILSVGLTSIQSLPTSPKSARIYKTSRHAPIFTTGHD
ncbi:hypothetical protein PLEOSDRAFT_1034604, partial [Pleurotus ostreatus PC15]